MTSTIRPTQLEDIDFAVSLVRDSFDRSLWPFMIYAQDGIAEFLAESLRNPAESVRSPSYVSIGTGGIEAFASFRLSGETDEGFLSYICVLPGARGRGVATQMIRQFLYEHPELHQLKLDVFAENHSAVALYKKLGFDVVSASVWASRPLPAPRGTVEIVGLPLSLAARQRFGFCELEVVSPTAARLGLVGSRVVNCRTTEAFQDDMLLAAVRHSFPGADTAFAVVAQSDFHRVTVECDVINHTNRMVLDVAVRDSARGASHT